MKELFKLPEPFKPGEKVRFKPKPGGGHSGETWVVKSCEWARAIDLSWQWVVNLVGLRAAVPAEELEPTTPVELPALDSRIVGALNATLMTMRPALVDMAIGYMKESEHGRLEPETVIKILEALKELVDETHKARQVIEEAKREVDNAYRASQGAFRRLGEVVGANLGLDEGDD